MLWLQGYSAFNVNDRALKYATITLAICKSSGQRGLLNPLLGKDNVFEHFTRNYMTLYMVR